MQLLVAGLQGRQQRLQVGFLACLPQCTWWIAIQYLAEATHGLRGVALSEGQPDAQQLSGESWGRLRQPALGLRQVVSIEGQGGFNWRAPDALGLAGRLVGGRHIASQALGSRQAGPAGAPVRQLGDGLAKALGGQGELALGFQERPLGRQ